MVAAFKSIELVAGGRLPVAGVGWWPRGGQESAQPVDCSSSLQCSN
jgi:hypothetical protein